MASNRGGVWVGGYIRKDANGRRVFYIRRTVAGRRIEVSTKCSTLPAATAELERFEKDPEGWLAGGDGAVALTAELVGAFLRWSLDDRKNTRRHVGYQKAHLAWWAEVLGSADLRKVKASRVVAALDGVRSRRLRLAALKAFCTWLVRERHLMQPHENPVAGVALPQVRPEQWKKKKAISEADLRALRDALDEDRKACLVVLAATGWHATELERFAEGGTVGDDGQGGAILESPRRKSGEPMRSRVGQEAAGAARRVRARGKAKYKWLRDGFRDVSKKLGLDARPGMLRHTVATFAVDSGAQLSAVADFLGHRSVQTTKRFYATMATAAKVPTPLG